MKRKVEDKLLDAINRLDPVNGAIVKAAARPVIQEMRKMRKMLELANSMENMRRP